MLTSRKSMLKNARLRRHEPNRCKSKLVHTEMSHEKIVRKQQNINIMKLKGYQLFSNFKNLHIVKMVIIECYHNEILAFPL